MRIIARHSCPAGRSNAPPSPARWFAALALLLCDEPTGNLDAQTAETVADVLLRLQVQQHTTLLVVTHSTALAARFDRRLAMAEGRIQEA